MRPSRIRAEQDRELARSVRNEVYPFSPFYGPILDACGLGHRGVRRQEDLARVPPIGLGDIDAAAVVLRPAPASVAHSGPPSQRVAARWAQMTGRAARFARASIDPAFKPVRWTLADGVPIGESAADIERLADVGRRMLEVAGLRSHDVLIGIGEAGGGHAWFWQVATGARNGGVATLFLPAGADPDALASLHPSVVAGRPTDVHDVLATLALARRRLPELHTLVVAGDGLRGDERAELVALATEARGHSGPGDRPVAVVHAWAPPGARALWAECRGGDAYHTWPDAELVQVAGQEAALDVAEGRLLWTALGWRGSVLVRLDTRLDGVVDRRPCPVCGRTTPRVRLGSFG